MKKLFTYFSLMALTAVGIASAQNLSLPPEEVVNVSATAGNGFVNVSWDRADDPDGIVTGYKIYYGTNSVQDIDDYYDGEVEVIGETSYILENLENGVTYYMAVTALDDEGYESETYSLEVSATPEAPAEDIVVDEQPAPVEETPVVEEDPIAVEPAEEVTPIEGAPEETPAEEVVEEPAPVEEVVVPVEEEPVLPEEVPVVEPVEEIGNIGAPEDEVLEPSAPKANVSEVRGLTADKDQLSSEGIVILNWETSRNENLIAQYLYVNIDNAGWEEPILLEKTATNIELEVEENTNYEFRIATIDASGVESAGVALSVSTTLAESGTGMYGIALVLAVMAGALYFRRKSNLG